MAKVTKAHIRAARARKQILTSQNRIVPEKILKLASLDLNKYPAVRDAGPHGRHLTDAVREAVHDDVPFNAGFLGDPRLR